MNFNNIINHLKLWCTSKANAYYKVYSSSGGVTYVGYLVASELIFKLSTLIDKPFQTVDAFKGNVIEFIDVHYDPPVLKPQNSLAEHIINQINQEFSEYLEELLSRKESLALADIPYARAIIGAEAAALQDMFRSVWEYENTSCWFPLMRDRPKGISEKFFIMFDHFEPYKKKLEQIIGLPHTHIYSYKECCFRPHHCVETVELIEYCGLETIYTDKDFSWAIYFSHEFTVTFAGSIVPKVRTLLSNEKDHWNRLE